MTTKNIEIKNKNHLIKTIGKNFPPDLSLSVAVEFYPNNKRKFAGHVFSYQFFNNSGLNIGYYVPDTKTLTILGTARMYRVTISKWIDTNECKFENHTHLPYSY